MFSSVILIAYLVIYIARYGIPEHISATYEKFGIWFTIVIWMMCLEFGMVAFERYEDIGWLSFILVAALMFVGASPMLDERVEGLIHRVAATLAIFVSGIWAWVVNPIGMLAYFIALFGNSRNWLFWVELSCIFSIYIALL